MPLQKDLQQDCAEQMIINASKQVLGTPYAFNYGSKDIADEQVDFTPAVMFGDDSERQLWTSGANEQTLLTDLNALSTKKTYFMRTGKMGGAGHYQMLSFEDKLGWKLYSSEDNKESLTDPSGNLTEAGRSRMLTQPNVVWGKKMGEYCISVIEATPLTLNLAAQYVYDIRMSGEVKATENLYSNADNSEFYCHIDATTESKSVASSVDLVKQEPIATFEFASEDLKKDRNFVLAAIEQNGFALSSAREGLKNDKEFVVAADSKKLSSTFLLKTLSSLAFSAAVLAVGVLILASVIIPPIAPVLVGALLTTAGIASVGFFANSLQKQEVDIATPSARGVSF